MKPKPEKIKVEPPKSAFELGISWAALHMTKMRPNGPFVEEYFWYDAEVVATLFYTWDGRTGWEKFFGRFTKKYIPRTASARAFLDGANTIAALNGIRPRQIDSLGWPEKI